MRAQLFSKTLSNNSMQRTALHAAADAGALCVSSHPERAELIPRKRAVTLLLVAFATTSFGDVPPLSAECAKLEPTEALKYAPVAFVGDLLRVESGLATLRVIERLKGKVPNEVVVREGAQGLESWRVFVEPGRYLVFAEHLSSDDPAWRGLKFAIPLQCPQTRLLSDVNARELQTLQRYVRANRKTLAPAELK